MTGVVITLRTEKDVDDLLRDLREARKMARRTGTPRRVWREGQDWKKWALEIVLPLEHCLAHC